MLTLARPPQATPKISPWPGGRCAGAVSLRSCSVLGWPLTQPMERVQPWSEQLLRLTALAHLPCGQGELACGGTAMPERSCLHSLCSDHNSCRRPKCSLHEADALTMAALVRGSTLHSSSSRSRCAGAVCCSSCVTKGLLLSVALTDSAETRDALPGRWRCLASVHMASLCTARARGASSSSSGSDSTVHEPSSRCMWMLSTCARSGVTLTLLLWRLRVRLCRLYCVRQKCLEVQLQHFDCGAAVAAAL